MKNNKEIIGKDQLYLFINHFMFFIHNLCFYFQELLTTKYNVRGFPTLVILDKTGRTVTTGGRSCVLKKTGDEDVLQWE